MNENKYDPIVIHMHTVTYFELKNNPRKPLTFVFADEDFQKYEIDIDIKDSIEIYLLFKSGLYRGVSAAGHARLIQDRDELEKKKDLLGKVVVKKEGKEVATFKDFKAFEETIKWE
jgi:hypothetical protein